MLVRESCNSGFRRAAKMSEWDFNLPVQPDRANAELKLGFLPAHETRHRSRYAKKLWEHGRSIHFDFMGKEKAGSFRTAWRTSNMPRNRSPPKKGRTDRRHTQFEAPTRRVFVTRVTKESVRSW